MPVAISYIRFSTKEQLSGSSLDRQQKKVASGYPSDLPTSQQLVTDTGITGQVRNIINDMLIDLMATMARLVADKCAKGEKVGGKGRNREKWNKVAGLLKRNGNTMEEIAKLADVGIATVYRIKKELSESV